MEMGEFMMLWCIAMPTFWALISLWQHRKKPEKPAAVTHQATPFLITQDGEYVESLDGKAPQKRSRSV